MTTLRRNSKSQEEKNIMHSNEQKISTLWIPIQLTKTHLHQHRISGKEPDFSFTDKY